MLTRATLDQPLTWQQLERTATVKLLAWAVRSRATTDQPLSWDLFARATATQLLRWAASDVPPLVTPPERTVSISPEDRTAHIAPEAPVVAINREDRTVNTQESTVTTLTKDPDAVLDHEFPWTTRGWLAEGETHHRPYGHRRRRSRPRLQLSH